MPERREIREIDRFAAEDDAGNRYEVVELQTFISTQTLAGDGGWIKGTISARLSDGRAINHIDDDTYEIVSNGVTIRRVK